MKYTKLIIILAVIFVIAILIYAFASADIAGRVAMGMFIIVAFTIAYFIVDNA